jgi:hypothetical protein
MRSAQKRTIEDAWRHIGSLVETIDPTECNKLLRQRRIRFRQKMKRSSGPTCSRDFRIVVPQIPSSVTDADFRACED